MGVNRFEDLRVHVGHKIAVVMYGNENVAVECKDCNSVLFYFNRVIEEVEEVDGKPQPHDLKEALERAQHIRDIADGVMDSIWVNDLEIVISTLEELL